MARKIRTKTMRDGTKAKIITDDRKPVLIYQKIINVNKDYVQVVSKNGKEYWVKLSDKVKMVMKPEIGDESEIKTFSQGWLVVDLIKDPLEPSSNLELESLKQMKELLELQGGSKEMYNDVCNKIKKLEDELDEEFD